MCPSAGPDGPPYRKFYSHVSAYLCMILKLPRRYESNRRLSPLNGLQNHSSSASHLGVGVCGQGVVRALDDPHDHLGEAVGGEGRLASEHLEGEWEDGGDQSGRREEGG